MAKKVNIFEDVAEIKQNLDGLQIDEATAEFFALYSIAQAVARRYDEIATDYNHEGDQRTQAVYDAAQKMQDIISQDFGKAMYFEYITHGEQIKNE